MSNKNTAWCDIANESDFYSCSWEGSFSLSRCSCKDLTASDSESDRHPDIDTKGQYHSLGEEREKSKRTNDLTEAHLVSGNNLTTRKNNCRDCLLLQEKKSQYSRGSQKEKAPKSIPPSRFKRNQTIDHPSASCSATVPQSRSVLSSQKDLFSKSEGPQLFSPEQPTQGPAFFTIKKAYIVNKLHRKHLSADSAPTSKCNKAVQASFSCRGEDPGEYIVCECSKQSPCKEERNRKLDKKKTAVFHNTESIANQDSLSGELVNGHLHCPLEAVTDKNVKPPTPKHWCVPITASTLVISLALEAGYSVPSASLAGAETKYISSSKVRKVRGDSSRPSLAFKLKEPELNQYFNKLHISIVPESEHLDTDTQKQAIPFTGQVELQQVSGPEANEPLETQTDSSDSDIPEAQIEQASSVFKPLSANQFFVSSEDTQDTVWPPPSHNVQKIPCRKGIYIKEPSEEPKRQFKVCRSTRHPAVSTKPKEAQRDRRLINKPCLSSNLYSTKTLETEPFKQKPGNYKTVTETETDTLNNVPLSEAVKCHCSPLYNLDVNLYPKRRYSGIETSLSINRKPSKRGGGVTRRFSAQSLLSDRDTTEELQYIAPAKRKKDLKMQSILNFCFGWPGTQKKHERSPRKGEIFSTAGDPETKEEGLLSPPPLTERRSLTAPFLQDERESQSPTDGTLHPEDNLSPSDFPYIGNISNLVQSPEQRNMFKADNNVPLEKLDSETTQVPSGDSILKKLMFCRCGQMPQHGLFPSGDIFQLVSKTPRSSPATGIGPCKPKPASMCCHREIPANMNETYWYSHQSVLPTQSSLENLHKQEATRGQFANTQSYFENSVPAKSMTDELPKEGKQMEMGECRNIRRATDAATMQQICAHGVCTATPSEDGGREKTLPEYSVYHPNCCPSCQLAATQKRGTPSDYYNCFKSKQKAPKSSLSIERGFTVDPCLGNRSQCKCSQEIPIPYMEQNIAYEERRATLPKRKDPELIQIYTHTAQKSQHARLYPGQTLRTTSNKITRFQKLPEDNVSPAAIEIEQQFNNHLWGSPLTISQPLPVPYTVIDA